MLVAVMLLGVVMTMLTTFVASSSRQYTKGTREARMQMEAQETMNFIERLVTDGTADSGCFSFSGNVFTAYILKDTTLSKYMISFDQSEKMLRYTRQDKIYGAYDATAGKPIVEPGSATMNSGWAAASRQNIPLSKYVSGFSVDLSELSSLGMFRVNLEFSLEGAEYSASRTYNIRNISEINDRTKWINSLGEEDFDSEGQIYRGQSLNLNDYAKDVLKLTDTYTGWMAKAGAENNDQIQTGSTSQITLENGVLTVKAGYDWTRDIKLQLTGQSSDGGTQIINLHLAAVTIVGENKSFSKSDLIGQTLTSNVKGILADNAGLAFKLFYSESKINDYTNGFSGLTGVTLVSGQQATLMSGGSAAVKVTAAKEVSQGAGIAKNRLTVIPQECNKDSGYLYIVPYKSGTSDAIQTSGVAEIAISNGGSSGGGSSGGNTPEPTQAPTEAPTEPPTEAPTQPVVTELADEIVLENLKATVTGVSRNVQDWGFEGNFNVQLTGATGMSHNKLRFRIHVPSANSFSLWDRSINFSQVSNNGTNVSQAASYLDMSCVVSVNDINQSEIETASVNIRFGPPNGGFSTSSREYLNNLDKCIEVYYAGQLISPAASYSPSSGGGGGGNNGGNTQTEPATDPNAPKSTSVSASVNGTNSTVSASFVNATGMDMSKLTVRLYVGNVANQINVWTTQFSYQNAQIGANSWDCLWSSGGSTSKGSNYVEAHTGANATLKSATFSFSLDWQMGGPSNLSSILADVNDRIEIYYNGLLISPKSKYH